MLDFLYSIIKAVVVELLKHLILFKDKRKWLKEHPEVKYKIDLSFYVFNKYVYYPALSIGFTLYGVSMSLFDPNYNTLPRFTAAWIILAAGLSAAVLFQYLNRDHHRPVRPLE